MSINSNLVAPFLSLLRTNFYMSKHENLSNYVLRHYDASNSLLCPQCTRTVLATQLKVHGQIPPLQVTKVVQFMAANYLAKRKPCSDNHTMRIIWSAFFKTHLKTKGIILRYSS